MKVWRLIDELIAMDPDANVDLAVPFDNRGELGSAEADDDHLYGELELLAYSPSEGTVHLIGALECERWQV